MLSERAGILVSGDVYVSTAVSMLCEKCGLYHKITSNKDKLIVLGISSECLL